MEEDGEVSTPFWVESSSNHRRRSSSLFLNSGVLVFLLCLSAVVLIFFVIPSVVSFTARIFRPNLVKKSWDSINGVLVLFALVFGFLSRNKSNDSNFDEHRRSGSSRNDAPRSDPSTPHQWYEYSERTVYSSAAATGGLRRTFSSYPDLREVSSWDTADDPWRFSDDTQVNAYRYSDSDQLRRRRIWKQVQEDDSDYSKTIHVDTLVTRAKEVSDTPIFPSSSPPPPASPPPPTPPLPQQQKRTPESIALREKREKQVKNEAEYMKSQTPPSPPPAVHRKHKRTFDSVSHKEKREEQAKNKYEPIKSQKSPMVPPPPPPPPLIFSEKKSSKSERKRGGSNAAKDFLASLYHQSKKKKKQRQKSVDNFEILLLRSQAPPLNLLPPPSGPPPPPSPPSDFHTLISSTKGDPPPSPPPQPPVTAARASKIAVQVSPIAAREHPMPVKISSFGSVEESPSSGTESPLTGCESPLIPIPPPPPPPPPFKMPTWRYKVQGDYVRIESMSSSRSGSPDLDDAESPTVEISTESGGNTSAVDGSEAVGPIFCPSPDVNTKADVFIARFRAGLKLQKLNSLKQKQGLGLSNLGPESK